MNAHNETLAAMLERQPGPFLKYIPRPGGRTEIYDQRALDEAGLIFVRDNGLLGRPEIKNAYYALPAKVIGVEYVFTMRHEVWMVRPEGSRRHIEAPYARLAGLQRQWKGVLKQKGILDNKNFKTHLDEIIKSYSSDAYRDDPGVSRKSLGDWTNARL